MTTNANGYVCTYDGRNIPMVRTCPVPTCDYLVGFCNPCGGDDRAMREIKTHLENAHAAAPADESPGDLTVYDLAERMAAGVQLSTAAQKEVAAELLRVTAQLKRVNIELELYWRAQRG